jgi:CheY-like chemotaxis protein
MPADAAGSDTSSLSVARALAGTTDYLLEAHGYTPLIARTGEEGVELAAQERPDLILLDIRLPGMDGYEIAATLKLRSELEQTRIVAVTASVTASDLDRIVAAGLDGYIAKPIEPETFMGEISRFLPTAIEPASRSEEP